MENVFTGPGDMQRPAPAPAQALGTNLSNQERYVLQLLVDLDKMTGIAKENKNVAMEVANQRDEAKEQLAKQSKIIDEHQRQLGLWEPAIIAHGTIKTQLNFLINRYSNGSLTPEECIEEISTLYREVFSTVNDEEKSLDNDIIDAEYSEKDDQFTRF